MNLATCTCRRHAWDPRCPKHPPVGRLRYAASLVCMVALVGIAAVAVFTAPAQASSTRAICKVFGSRCAAAVRVARCESRLNPRALGSAGERGLFQIHPVHFGWAKKARLFEPRYNALVAYRLSRGGTSWRHWTCGWTA